MTVRPVQLNPEPTNGPVSEYRAKVYDGDVFGTPHGGTRASGRKRDEEVVSLGDDNVDLVLVAYGVVKIRGDGQPDLLPKGAPPAGEATTIVRIQKFICRSERRN